MECTEFKKLIERRIKRGLGGRRGAEFHEHEESCTSCHRELWRAETAFEFSMEKPRALPIDIRAHDGEVPIVRILYTVIERAIEAGANEIRVAVSSDGVSVAYLAGGASVGSHELPDYVAQPLLARIKAMAGMDWRRDDCSQSGETRICCGDREYAISIATDPVDGAESATLCIS